MLGSCTLRVAKSALYFVCGEVCLMTCVWQSLTWLKAPVAIPENGHSRHATAQLESVSHSSSAHTARVWRLSVPSSGSAPILKASSFVLFTALAYEPCLRPSVPHSPAVLLEVYMASVIRHIVWATVNHLLNADLLNWGRRKVGKTHLRLHCDISSSATSLCPSSHGPDRDNSQRRATASFVT